MGCHVIMHVFFPEDVHQDVQIDLSQPVERFLTSWTGSCYGFEVAYCWLLHQHDWPLSKMFYIFTGGSFSLPFVEMATPSKNRMLTMIIQ